MQILYCFFDERGYIIKASASEGEDEGGDGHEHAGEGEPHAGVGGEEGIAGDTLLLLYVDDIVLLQVIVRGTDDISIVDV